MITANWMVKFYAPIAWTITQQSVTSAVQESGAKMLKVMITPVFADNATTTLAVKNAIHSFTMMMLMSMMTAIFATSAIRESEKTQQSMNTVTSLNQFSTVIQTVILVWNLKSTEQAKMMIMQRKSLILQI